MLIRSHGWRMVVSAGVAAADCRSRREPSGSYGSTAEQLPGGRGLGVFYWEATWTAVTGNGWEPADASSGNGWETRALSGYDDRALSSTTWFGHRWPSRAGPGRERTAGLRAVP